MANKSQTDEGGESKSPKKHNKSNYPSALVDSHYDSEGNYVEEDYAFLERIQPLIKAKPAIEPELRRKMDEAEDLRISQRARKQYFFTMDDDHNLLSSSTQAEEAVQPPNFLNEKGGSLKSKLAKPAKLETSKRDKTKQPKADQETKGNSPPAKAEKLERPIPKVAPRKIDPLKGKPAKLETSKPAPTKQPRQNVKGNSSPTKAERLERPIPKVAPKKELEAFNLMKLLKKPKTAAAIILSLALGTYLSQIKPPQTIINGISTGGVFDHDVYIEENAIVVGDVISDHGHIDNHGHVVGNIVARSGIVRNLGRLDGDIIATGGSWNAGDINGNVHVDLCYFINEGQHKGNVNMQQDVKGDINWKRLKGEGKRDTRSGGSATYVERLLNDRETACSER